MSSEKDSRRKFLKFGMAGLGSALFLNACANSQTADSPNVSPNKNAKQESEKKDGEEKPVTAIEDLMREHGVLRRALLIYTSAAGRLRKNSSDISPDALRKTAELFRAFGEDYHEKKLEEGFIFPLIKQKGASGEAAKYPDILINQHNRGREITEYILSATNAAKIKANAAALADTLEGFVWMYQNHAAREDTIVFPAWKDLLSEADYKELGEKFEEIEKQQFGGDGFDDAVELISDIETNLNLADISKFTPPAPPAVK